MPPTLVASSYGMNFEHMLELRLLVDCPYALGLLAGLAIIRFVRPAPQHGYQTYRSARPADE
jgi:Mg2+ and Co2+ transporter CorA